MRHQKSKLAKKKLKDYSRLKVNKKLGQPNV